MEADGKHGSAKSCFEGVLSRSHLSVDHIQLKKMALRPRLSHTMSRATIASRNDIYLAVGRFVVASQFHKTLGWQSTQHRLRAINSPRIPLSMFRRSHLSFQQHLTQRPCSKARSTSSSHTETIKRRWEWHRVKMQNMAPQILRL